MEIKVKRKSCGNQSPWYFKIRVGQTTLPTYWGHSHDEILPWRKPLRSCMHGISSQPCNVFFHFTTWIIENREEDGRLKSTCERMSPPISFPSSLVLACEDREWWIWIMFDEETRFKCSWKWKATSIPGLDLSHHNNLLVGFWINVKRWKFIVMFPLQNSN